MAFKNFPSFLNQKEIRRSRLNVLYVLSRGSSSVTDDSLSLNDPPVLLVIQRVDIS